MPIIFILISIVTFVTFTNFVSNIATALLMALTSVCILIKDGIKDYGGKGLPCLLLFCGIALIYYLFGYGYVTDNTLKGWSFNIILLISTFVIAHHIGKLNYFQIRNLLFLSLVSFSICLFITIIIGLRDPMAVRIYGFGDVEGLGSSEGRSFRAMGMMSYSYAHTISIISVGAALLVCYSQSKRIKIVCCILLCLMIVLQFIMTITTALLISILCSGLIIISKLARNKILITVGLSALILILAIGSGIIIDILMATQDFNNDIFLKFNDLYNSITTLSSSGQMGYREELYENSLNSFLGSPFLGGAIDDGSRRAIGQHSFLLDYLAFYGVLGLLFFGAIWKEYKTLYKTNVKLIRQLYYFTFTPVLLLAVTKAQSVNSEMPFMSLVFIQFVFRYLFPLKTSKVIKTA